MTATRIFVFQRPYAGMLGKQNGPALCQEYNYPKALRLASVALIFSWHQICLTDILIIDDCNPFRQALGRQRTSIIAAGVSTLQI